MPHLAVRSKQRTWGGALLELCLVLLLLVLLTFGAMEYGWMFFRIQQVTNAARSGARSAVLPDATGTDVGSIVDAMMSGWGIYSGSYTMSVSPGDITSVEPGQIITVTVEIPYDTVKLTGMSIFPTPTTLRASASMAKEGP